MRLKKWMVLLTSVDEMKLFRSERTKCERRTKKKEYKRYNIKNHFWWWKIIKKCNCYLGECAESDHYLLSSPYFLRTSLAIRVMKGKSINFFYSSSETLYPPSSHLIVSLTLATSNFKLLRQQFSMLTAPKRDCSILRERNVKRVPIPFRAHWGMKIWQLNINIFMLTILFVPFSIYFPWLSSINWLSFRPSSATQASVLASRHETSWELAN